MDNSTHTISDDIKDLIKNIKEKIPCEDKNGKFVFMTAVGSSRVEEIKAELEKIKDDINFDVTFQSSDLVDDDTIYVSLIEQSETKYKDYLDDIQEDKFCEFIEDCYHDYEEVCDDDKHISYLSENELKRKIKYTKNPLERRMLERELGYMTNCSRHKSTTKKRNNKRRKK